MSGKEDESGATATAVFIGEDMLLISHLGDSSVVCIMDPLWCPLTSYLTAAFNGNETLIFC